ncbi:hypothetical protein DL93DRAFT_2029847, partial [Clavulina sp. PMI_390]
SSLVQLRTGHAPLRGYLARFCHADTPHCERCGEAWSVRHYLATCRQHNCERMELQKKVRVLEDPSFRNKGFDLSALLSHPDVIPLTLKFIATTRQI